MIIIAAIIIAIGLVSALLGLKVFRLVLPFLGLLGGFAVGFAGVQAVFGTGAISTTLAVIFALFTGVLLAVLSYAFFELAVVILAAITGASVLSFLGIALGLQENGFVVFLLGLTGAILGFLIASQYSVGVPLVITVTSLYGVAAILVGFMLVVGNVSLDDLQNNGIVPTIVSVVDQSLLWLFVWLGGSLIATRIQTRTMPIEMLGVSFEYKDKVTSQGK